MKVLKFGGTSVGTDEGLSNIIKIVKELIEKNEKFCLVCSAFAKVTDKLITASGLAVEGIDFKKEFDSIKDIHLHFIKNFLSKPKKDFLQQIEKQFDDLYRLLNGVYLLKELSPRTKDLILSFGERLSCQIITEILNNNNIEAEYIDARNILVTDDNFGKAKVNYELSLPKVKDTIYKNDKVKVITGFIGATQDGVTTTLGRGGSDFTASIIGSLIDATEIQIWTDVDGILTADPRKVKNAVPLKAVTYEEAMEMSYFGAKVIYSPTILPALQKNIKIRIKNTFNPAFPGTVILPREKGINFTFKSISSIPNIAVLRYQSFDKYDEAKLIEELRKNNIEILLFGQASSQKNTIIAIYSKDLNKAKKISNLFFKREFGENKDLLHTRDNLALIVVVAEDIIDTPGITGRVFGALGKNAINVQGAILGSSETNISIIIDNKDEQKAVNVLHNALFVKDVSYVNLFLFGPGLVGKELLSVLNERYKTILEQRKVSLRLVGIANSKYFYFDKNGIDIQNWQNLITKGEKSNIESFINEIIKMNLENSIFLDCSGIKEIIEFYPKLLNNSIAIVTPSKIANSMDYEFYQTLRRIAYQRNTVFRYSANVGAALPIINTIKDLVVSGDKNNRIEGVLSGTLSYLFNEFNTSDKSFSQLVKDAKAMGYTEPDPRDDLNGLDVARKILILARETGAKLNLNDVEVENLVPEELRDTKISPEEFLNKLEKYDDYFNSIKQNALKQNKKLCYIASYENEKASVSLQTIDSNHPFYNLSSNDAIVSVYSNNYNNKPMVIRGAGAGAKLTAVGVFSDILRVVDYLI